MRHKKIEYIKRKIFKWEKMIKLLKHKSAKLFATYMRAKHLYSPVLLTKRKILINEQERNTIVLNKDKR